MEYESKLLKPAKKILLILGTWPLNTLSPYANIAYKIYSNMILSCYTAFVVSVIIGIKDIMHASSEEQAHVLQYIFSYIIFLWKMLLSQKASVRRLMKIISEKEREILSDKDEGLNSVYRYCLKYNKTLFNIIFYVFTTIMCIFVGVLLSDIKAWPDSDLTSNFSVPARKLPLPQYFPFSDKIPFEVKFGFQGLVRLFAGIIYAGCNVLFISLVYFPVAHLKVLGYKFKHFGDKTGNGLIPPEAFLRSLVLEHKQIIDYVYDLNEILKWMLFIDFLLQSYHTSLTLIELMALIGNLEISVEFIVTLSMSLTYLLATFLEMCCLYYTANEIMIESVELANNIYHSNWYMQSLLVKRSFLIVIIRSQRPLELRIGNLYTITNDLIVKFVKAGFTFILFSRVDSQYI